MRLSVNTGPYVKKGFGDNEIIDLIASAGFDAIDFSFFDKRYYNEQTDNDEFKCHFLELRKQAEEKGLVFNQAHAPFPTGSSDKQEEEKIFQDMVRSMRNASYLGVKTIVVHPRTHLRYANDNAPEQLFEQNMELYRRLIPYCEEYQIKVAVENMWGKYVGRKITHHVCSRPEEFIRYVDALDSEWIVACLDVGHACLVCEEPADMIKKLGAKRLQALHIHDVDGLSDQHTLPYLGIIEWEKVMAALKEIGYRGDFTFETDGFLKDIPRGLVSSATKHLETTGRYLMQLIEA